MKNKIKNILGLGLLTIAVASFAETKHQGEIVFENKCASCHVMSPENMKGPIVAPPMIGFMFHMTDELKTQENIKAHIKDFIVNPTLEKALCKSVKRFGLMPSLKDKITEQEIEDVSTWLSTYKQISKEQYLSNKKAMSRR